MHGHVPVLRDRVTELIADPVREMGDKAVIVDGTLGVFLEIFSKGVRNWPGQGPISR